MAISPQRRSKSSAKSSPLLFLHTQASLPFLALPDALCLKTIIFDIFLRLVVSGGQWICPSYSICTRSRECQTKAIFFFYLPKGMNPGERDRENEREKPLTPHWGMVVSQSSSLHFSILSGLWTHTHTRLVVGWDVNCGQPCGIELPVHGTYTVLWGQPKQEHFEKGSWETCF